MEHKFWISIALPALTTFVLGKPDLTKFVVMWNR